MAHWDKRTVKGREYLFVYTFRDGAKQQVKPRSLYKHLDGASESSIQAWVDDWARQWEKSRITPDHLLYSDDSLALRVREWELYLRAVKGRSPRTIQKYSSMLRRWAFPFFLQSGLKDPGTWPGVSIGLFPYFQEKGCSQALIQEVNNALRSFFRYLQEEGLVHFQGDLKLRNSPRLQKETPLQFTLKPEDVLGFIRASRSREVKLLALCGYFLSLRPQETFALRPMDFLAGDQAAGLEGAAAMQQAGLFDRLAVNIERQQTALREEVEPKSHSKGWVHCWQGEAAQLLVGILNDAPESLQLLPKDNRAIYRRWERATRGKKGSDGRYQGTALTGITLKDLRRASLYYLGFHTRIQEAPMHLMKHARHKEFETTLIYLRRPKEKPLRQPGKLQLGA